MNLAAPGEVLLCFYRRVRRVAASGHHAM